MLKRELRDAGAEGDVVGHPQRLGDDELRHRDVLPGQRRVLSDPGLLVPEPVGQHKKLQIAFPGLVQLSVGKVEGHLEQSQLHRFDLLTGVR